MEDKSYRRTLHSIIENHIPKDILDERNKSKSWDYGYNKEFDMVVISKNGTIGNVIDINDLVIALPKQPEKIRNERLMPKDQKWHRYKVPDELMNFDKYYSDSEDLDMELMNVYNRHESFIKQDFDRLENGDWFLNDGNAVYLTGYAYFFFQHYYLTDMKRYPDLRMTQIDYFYWLEACIADYRCAGSLYLKNRRSFFSVSSASMVILKGIRTFNGFFPIVSKNEKNSEKLFTKQIVKPFNRLPKHLQPQRVGEVDPKKELYFSSPKRKITTKNKTNGSSEGLDTLISVYPTTLDAYDGEQSTMSINDEIGKMKGNLDINEYWEQAHKECHIVGSEVVGKALCGSTANPPTQGGRNYEKFYQDSKISIRDKFGNTKTGLYALFIKADYMLMGFFDEWGYVIYDNPPKPIKNEIGKMVEIGSKQFLDDKELSVLDDPKKYNSRKRNFPRTDTDPFRDEDATSMFGTEGVTNLKNFLKEYSKTDEYKSKVTRFNLRWKDGIVDGEVERVINPNGKFIGCWQPPRELLNRFVERDGKKYPVNGHIGAFSCDPYDTSRVRFGTGSKMGFKGLTTDDNYALIKEEDRNLLFLHYNHRPNTIDEAEEDVIMAIKYFSMPILVEINKDSLGKKLKARGYRGYCLTNPLKQDRKLLTEKEIELGGIHYSNSDSQKKQLDSALENWLIKNLPNKVDEKNIKIPYIDVLEELEIYKPEDRQKRDGTVALQYVVVAANHYKLRKTHSNQDFKNQNINFRQIFAN